MGSQNTIIVTVRNVQVGDYLVLGTINYYAGNAPQENTLAEVVGVNVNMSQCTVDLKTTIHAVWNIPWDMEIEIVRN